MKNSSASPPCESLLPFLGREASKSKWRAEGQVATRLLSRTPLMSFRLSCIVVISLLPLGAAVRAQDAALDRLPVPTLYLQYLGDNCNILTPPGHQASNNTPQTSPDTKANPPQKKTSNDRILWTMPNFLTLENAANIPALSAKEKFRVTARGVFDPFEFVLTGFVAGLNQAADSNPTYGQGMQGYAKRYGTAYGDNFVENFMASAALPSLLHQDPRFYQLGHGGFLRRTAHALSRVFITRSDAGQSQPNYSELGGAFGAAAISIYSYHPHSERGIGDVVSVWGTQMSWDAATYVIKEFWPDLRKHSRKKAAPAPAPAQTPKAQ